MQDEPIGRSKSLQWLLQTTSVDLANNGFPQLNSYNIEVILNV